MGFATDSYGAGKIIIGEGLQGGKDSVPPGLPRLQQGGTGGGWVDEFVVAVPVGLLAVFGEEVGPTRMHVADHMFHNESDGIGFFVEGSEQVLVRNLFNGAFGELLVVAEEREGILEIRSGELDWHDVSSAASHRFSIGAVRNGGRVSHSFQVTCLMLS